MPEREMANVPVRLDVFSLLTKPAYDAPLKPVVVVPPTNFASLLAVMIILAGLIVAVVVGGLVML